MSTLLVHRLANWLGCTTTYPDWYIVRRLLWKRCASETRRLMQQPTAKLLRDPGLVARLTLAGLPELRLFPDSSIRHRALREYGDSMRDTRDWRYWVVLAVMTALAASAGFVIGHIVARAFGTFVTGSARYWLRLATMLIVFWAMLRAAQRLGATARLRQRLLDLGVPVCAKCGYALFGHHPDAQQCPECGRPIDDRTRALLEDMPSILAQQREDDVMHLDRAA